MNSELMVLCSDTQENQNMDEDNFYSPLSISGYLTPLQRKKLKEKRSFTMFLNTESALKTPKRKKLKKPLRQSERKSKNSSIKAIQRRSKSIENFPHVRCTAAELIGKDKTPISSSKSKRFFKSRSPQHFQKSNYVMPLTYTKRSLDFVVEKEEAKNHLQAFKKSLLANTMLTIPVTVSNVNVVTTKPAEIDENDFIHNSKEENLDINTGKRRPTEKVKNINSHFLNHDSTLKVKVQLSSVQKSKLNNKKNISSDLFEFDWPTDEELLKRQNMARASLKESLSASFSERIYEETDVVESEERTPPKLYSIFTNVRAQAKELTPKRPIVKKSFCTKDTSKGGEQMIIDAGQREIGAKLCKMCNMIYTIGQEEDERLHSNFHHMFLVNLKFPGWKDEDIVREYDDGRVIQIKGSDKNVNKLKKVQDVLLIANRDLGFSSMGSLQRPNVTFLLFISTDKRVGGCLVAESIESACPVVLNSRCDGGATCEDSSIWKMSSWYASNETLPVLCGVNRIWVSQELRRQRVASRMLDCLRDNFIFGHHITLEELAFTDPSPSGREFAAAYMGTDNFLVYK